VPPGTLRIYQKDWDRSEFLSGWFLAFARLFLAGQFVNLRAAGGGGTCPTEVEKICEVAHTEKFNHFSKYLTLLADPNARPVP